MHLLSVELGTALHERVAQAEKYFQGASNLLDPTALAGEVARRMNLGPWWP
jgi:hypothetical protein